MRSQSGNRLTSYFDTTDYTIWKLTEAVTEKLRLKYDFESACRRVKEDLCLFVNDRPNVKGEAILHAQGILNDWKQKHHYSLKQHFLNNPFNPGKSTVENLSTEVPKIANTQDSIAPKEFSKEPTNVAAGNQVNFNHSHHHGPTIITQAPTESVEKAKRKRKQFNQETSDELGEEELQKVEKTKEHPNQETNEDLSEEELQKKQKIDKVFDEEDNNEERALEDEDVWDDEPPLFLNNRDAVVDLRRPTEELVLYDCNYSAKFSNYQNQVNATLQRNGFMLESNFFEVSSLSSVLPLKRNQYPDTLKPHFDPAQLDSLQNAMTEKFVPKYQDLEFDENVAVKIQKLVKQYMKNKTSFRDLRMELDNLAEDMDDDSARVIDCFISISAVLPEEEITSPLGEMELQSTYIENLLHPIFNSKSTKLRFPNKTTIAAKTDLINVNKGRRPDGVISKIIQGKYCQESGYGEVKIDERRADTYEMVRDLTRITLFNKHAIDLYEYENTLGFQAIGDGIVFYSMFLASDGLYLLNEFAKVDVPMNKKKLLDFVNQFDTLLLVVKMANTCNINSDKVQQAFKRSTISSPQFKTYVSSSKNRKRPTSLNF